MSTMRAEWEAHLQAFQAVSESAYLAQAEQVGHLLAQVLLRGNKVLVAGNGGSAADAQHFAAELVGRYLKEREAYPAIALTTDTSALTAIANDYGYDHVFSRQVAGLGSSGDLFIAISTSGNSPNLLMALETAAKRGIHTVGLTGKTGGKMVDLCDFPLVVPSSSVPRIQEVHGWTLHSLCLMVDDAQS